MTYNIIENEFQRARAAAYKLSILIGMDSLVYSVYEGASNKLLALKSVRLPESDQPDAAFTKVLDAAIKKEDLLNAPYGQTKITFAQGAATLVPQRLYNEEEKGIYLSELTADENLTDIQSDQLKPLKIRAVYKTNEAVIKSLKAHFPKARFYNIATPFLLGSHQLSQSNGEGSSAFLCIQKNTFQLGLLQKGELLFYNNFEFKAASDVLYFVLLSFEQYGFEPDSIPLYLSGQIINDSDIYRMLYRYINHLDFLPAPSFIHIGKAANAANHSFFFPLHSLVLC